MQFKKLFTGLNLSWSSQLLKDEANNEMIMKRTYNIYNTKMLIASK